MTSTKSPGLPDEPLSICWSIDGMTYPPMQSVGSGFVYRADYDALRTFALTLKDERDKLAAENEELRELRDGWCDEYTKARNCLREVMELLDSWDITHIGPEPLHEAETIWADTIRRAQEYCK
jgi:hypothetical protein